MQVTSVIEQLIPQNCHIEKKAQQEIINTSGLCFRIIYTQECVFLPLQLSSASIPLPSPPASPNLWGTLVFHCCCNDNSCNCWCSVFDDMFDPQVRVLCFIALNTKILMSQVTVMLEHQSPLVTGVGGWTLLTMHTVWCKMFKCKFHYDEHHLKPLLYHCPLYTSSSCISKDVW